MDGMILFMWLEEAMLIVPNPFVWRIKSHKFIKNVGRLIKEKKRIKDPPHSYFKLSLWKTKRKLCQCVGHSGKS